MADFKQILASILVKKPKQKGFLAQSKASIASSEAPHESLVTAAKRGAYGQGGYANTDKNTLSNRSQP